MNKTIFLPREGRPDTLFHARFTRHKESLVALARKLLQDEGGARTVVSNCRRTALAQMREFQNERDFCFWIFRILVDEAMVLVEAERGATRSRPVHALPLRASASAPNE